MLITKTVKQKWNAKTKKHYVELGYTYTKMGDEFDCKVEDLTNGSQARIEYKCDYCGNICNKSYYWYTKSREYIKKDCCDNENCTTQKAQDTIKIKYGVSNVRDLDWVNEKIKETNIQKYGCENPFGNQGVQQKIKDTVLQKYGVEYIGQNEEIQRKRTEGWKKYYETHEFPKGENSPCWKSNLTDEYRMYKRCSNAYYEWRKQVYERDNYTCQCCLMHRISSKQPPLNAHHIENYAQHEDKQTDINNGITLCKICHDKFHHIYGKKDNNWQQLEEFITLQQNNLLDENIC